MFAVQTNVVNATSETFTNSSSWSVPPNIYVVQVECWGGGGAGGSGNTNDSGGGNGGGGGAYAIVYSLSTTPSTSYDYVSGAAGSGGTGNGPDGANSTFNTTTCVADAGSGGPAAGTSNTGGAGGTTSGSTGDTKYAGGAGGNTTNGTDIPGAGGGSSGGSNSAGNTTTSAPTAATSVTDGGPGGEGGAAGGAGSSPASGPGGGGGGGGERSGGSEAGGSGFAGQIRVTYFETVTLSGTLFSDEGDTQITSGNTIKVAVGTTSPPTIYSTTTDSGAGTYSFYFPSDGEITRGTPITIWVDNDASTYASIVTKAKGIGSIENLHLYQDRVIVRHEAVTSTATSTTIADMSLYDGSDNSFIQFKASSILNTLDVNAGQELHIWTDNIFNPGGEIILHGNQQSGVDGDFHIGTSSTYTAVATTTLAGSWFASSTSVFTPGGETIFNASTTGKVIEGELVGDSSFASTSFNGSGGGWTFSNNASTTEFTITDGTVIAPSGQLTIEGNYSNSGTFTHNSGAIYFNSGASATSTLSGTMTGTNAFNNVTIEAGNESFSKVSQSTAGIIAEGGTTNIRGIKSMVDVNGTLYVGTQESEGGNLAEVYRYDGGNDWTLVTPGTPGTIVSGGTTLIDTIWSMVNVNGTLYVGTQETSRAEVYRYDGGTTWTKVSHSNSGTIAFNGIGSITYINSMANVEGTLYIGTWKSNSAEVYRYDGGTTWTKVSQSNAGTIASSGTPSIDGVSSMVNVNGTLYVGTNELNSTEVYRYDGGTTWVLVTPGTPGTIVSGGTTLIRSILSMVNINGTLYIGTFKTDDAEVYRYDGGTTWVKVSQETPGTIALGGTTDIGYLNTMANMNGTLHIGIGNSNSAEVYRYDGGTDWTKISQSTAGIIAEGGTTNIDEIRSMAVVSDTLYVGTWEINSAEVYRYKGIISIENNASTTDLTISEGTVIAPSGLLSIAGDYTNNGTFTHNSGTVLLNDTTTATEWSQAGTELNIVGGAPALTALNSTDVAFIDFSNEDLRVYRFDGSTWTLIGTELNIVGVSLPALTALNSTDVALIDGTNDDLRVYRFDGSTWTLIGTELNIAGVDSPALTALNSTDVAFIDSSNDDLRVYRFNGSTWTLIGTELNIAGAGNPALTALNSTDVALIDGTNDDLRVYRFNGSTWTLIGTELNIAGVGNPALTALNSTDVAFIDSSNDDLRVYRFGSAGFFGTMTGTSAFNNVTVTGSFAIFNTNASTTGTFTATEPNTALTFAAAATSSMGTFIVGGKSGNEVTLRSLTAGTPWGLNVSGSATVTFTDVKDSNACGSGNPNINAYDGTNVNSGGNFCWDFSAPSTVLTISGTLYSDEGVTEDTGGSDVIHVRVATSTPGVFSTTTDSGSGAWKIDTILKADMDPGVSIVAWVDNDSAKRASVFTKANHTSDDITGLDLYKDRVIIRHEGTQGTSTLLADLDFYDADNDIDIQYKVTGSALGVNAGQELHIWPGTEFAPEGAVILHGNAAASPDGDLHLARSATSSILTLGGNITIAGSYFASSSAIINNTNTITFSATTTGKRLLGSLTGSSAFGNVTFDGTGGSWTFNDGDAGAQNASTTDLTITNGTVIAPASGLLTVGGNYSNAGTFTHNSGTTYFTGSSKTYSGTMTDTSTFNDVVLTGSGLKTFSAQASTSAFTIENNAQFAGSALFSVSGNYNIDSTATFSHTGTMLFDGTSAQTLSGTMDTTTTDFGVIEFLGAGAKTFNANASTTNFTIDSTAGEVTAPSDRLSISGNYTNNGTFNANSGTVTFNGTASQTLSGTLISDGTNNSAFYNIEITNNTSEATTTFASSASTTNNFTVTALGARVEFTAGATSTLVNLIITGSSGNEIYLHSATENTQWNAHSTGTRAVTYANIKDSNACSSAGDINVYDGTSINEGNNDCWNFIVPSPTLTQRAYVFRNDDGQGGGGLASTTIQEATSTPRTSVIQGEHMIVAFQLDNTGTATSSIPLRLQYDKDDNVWVDVATSTEIRYSLSMTGAKTSSNRFYQPIATSTGATVDNTCQAGGNFAGGRLYSNVPASTTPAGLASSTPLYAIDIGAGDCAEVAFAIHTGSSTLGTTYNLRLVQATTTVDHLLDNYITYPKITIESARNIRFSKQSFGTTTSLKVTYSTNNIGYYNSIAIGTDGYPVIASRDLTADPDQIIVTKCLDTSCSSYTNEVIIYNSNNIGYYNSLAIGADGYPVIASQDRIASPKQIIITKCGNISCSSYTNSVVTYLNSFGDYASLAIGTDGYPVIASQDGTAIPDQIIVTKCADASCGSYTNEVVTYSSDIGYYNSLAIGTDGYPVIASLDLTSSPWQIIVIKCSNASCSSYTNEVVTYNSNDIGYYNSLAIGTDGYPVIASRDTTANPDQIIVTKCADASCSSYTNEPVTYSPDNIGTEASLAIGTDGYPVIASRDTTASPTQIIITKCADASCSSYTNSPVTYSSNDIGYYNSLAIGTDGYPVIASQDFTALKLNVVKCNSFDCSGAETSVNANIPSDAATDLDFYLDKAGYTAATSSDDIYDSHSAASSTIAYQFVSLHSNNTDDITPEWEGQASGESQDLTLEIYRFGATNAWENVATQASPSTDTDYYLASQITTNLSDYYNGTPGGNYEIYTRVTMATTTGIGTLRTDSASTTFSTPAEGSATISSASAQTFQISQSQTAISPITITETASGGSITNANELRIAIATSSVDMLWYSSDTEASFTGTASGRVNNTVAFEGGDSVLVITVNSDFQANETLIISGLSFSTFGSVNAPTPGLTTFLDGASDTSANSTDSKDIAIKGTITASDHDAGVESNAFNQSATSITNGELVGFKLTPTGEEFTIHKVQFKLSGINGITIGDFTNAKLYIDYGADGNITTGDEQFGGPGTVVFSDASRGYITFNADFNATTTRNYIIRADITNISPGNAFVIGITEGGITSTGNTSLASTTVPITLSGRQHIRVHRGSSPIGGDVSDEEDVQGGEVFGGEEIGNEPGYQTPTALGSTFSEWTTASNAYGSDGNYATEGTTYGRQDYGNFNFQNIPGSHTINGIEVKLEVSATDVGGDIEVALSWNGGAGTTTPTKSATTTGLIISDTVITLGGPSDKWGTDHTWVPADFVNGNFEVRVVAIPSGNTVRIDAIQVKVHEAATGGGSGGGGEVRGPVNRLFANALEASKSLFAFFSSFFSRL